MKFTGLFPKIPLESNEEAGKQLRVNCFAIKQLPLVIDFVEFDVRDGQRGT